MRRCCLLLIILAVLSPCPIWAGERGLDFTSKILAQGHGSRLGPENTIGMEDVGMEIKDGFIQALHSRDHNGRIRPGCLCTFACRTIGRFGKLEAHAEFYSRVNGDGWQFSLDRDSFEVAPPKGVTTGKSFSKGGNGSKEQHRGDAATMAMHFASSRPYSPGKDLAIVVRWLKGAVPGSILLRQLDFPLKKNQILAIIGVAVLGIYYLTIWYKVGRDPRKGLAIPRFAPPKGLTPAMVRTLWRMQYDLKAFAATIVNMAVLGGLSITAQDPPALELANTAPKALSASELVVWEVLRKNGPRIELHAGNSKVLMQASQALEKHLQLESKYYLSNYEWMNPGMLFHLLIVAAATWPFAEEFFEPSRSGWIFFFCSFSFFTFFIACISAVVPIFLSLVTSTLKSSFAKKSGITYTIIGCSFFIAGAIFILLIIYSMIGLISLAVLLVMNYITCIFHLVIPAPTLAGQRLRDEIEGMRLYLVVAEKDKLSQRFSFGGTPEHYDKFLPYAIALEVETEWSEHFTDMLLKCFRDTHDSPQ